MGRAKGHPTRLVAVCWRMWRLQRPAVGEEASYLYARPEPPHPIELSVEDKADARESFARYSVDGAGESMTRTGMRLAVVSMFGYKPSKFELKSMLRRGGVDPGASHITWSQFE